MARAQQEKWFADVLVSQANPYRSFDWVNIPFTGTAATGYIPPGTLLTNTGGAPGTAAAVAHIMLQAVPARAAGTFPIRALVLSRDAEVNDAYILWGTVPPMVGPIGTNTGIIVRAGVHEQSRVSPSIDDFVVEEEGAPPPETSPPAEPAAV